MQQRSSGGGIGTTMGRSSLLATGALSLFLGSSVYGQESSCVQVADPTWAANCPCDAGSQYSFTMEGQTTVTANTVNVAVIIDASGSVGTADWELSKEFAKNTVASFAEQNLFTNGGSASFAQFSSDASEGGTFYSVEDFDAFVDADAKYSGGTDIISGIAKGRELLSASPATTSFMIVTTDGEAANPQDEADAARAEGTILYAVGVGSGPSEETLLAIGGDEANVFDVDNFEELDLALEDIVSASGGSVPCAATGATVAVQFNGMVTEATVDGGVATYDGGDVVVFTVDDLEATPTNFEVWLDLCGQPEGGEVIASVSYADAEGNTPDLSALEGEAVVPVCDSSDDDFYDFSFGFSYSYSYTYDPWYDEDSIDDGSSVPGPSPHYVETPFPTPASAPVEAPVYTAPTGGGGSPTSGAAPTAPVAAPTQPGTAPTTPGSAPVQAPVYAAPTGGGGSPTSGAAPTTPGSAPVQAPVYSAPTGGGGSPTSGAAPTTPGSAPVQAPVYSAPTGGGGSPTSGAAPTSDMEMCSNGVYGIESSSGKACCALTCGSCGGVGCSRRPGGSYGCCESEILEEGEACAATGASPCYIDGDEVLDPVIPSMSPVVSEVPEETAMPSSGGIGGGGGGSGSYSYLYSYSYDFVSWDEDSIDDQLFTWCTNGVPGVESAGGEVCCPADCGQCGGVGCGEGGAGDDCCTTEIMDYGYPCSETGTAPCYLDG
ncbi:unnamed protein product [Ectocarpus fasciculatus]